eukprot:CAMPEP_0114238626 /NCGR_PEP_ID=MMETSP0058-20121206/8023_1 /TAXON_ID=36894 /ORGANISM="Pyramimonas parkeae, CCMP726" /LENGTH=80 /DNA_ID=CAMNT_0001350745 /DNA_START=478 /DNA_END=720 /DNA_ORIENTATION=+
MVPCALDTWGGSSSVGCVATHAPLPKGRPWFGYAQNLGDTDLNDYDFQSSHTNGLLAHNQLEKQLLWSLNDHDSSTTLKA